jgi:hypothetical protein
MVSGLEVLPEIKDEEDDPYELQGGSRSQPLKSCLAEPPRPKSEEGGDEQAVKR